MEKSFQFKNDIISKENGEIIRNFRGLNTPIVEAKSFHKRQWIKCALS